MSFPVFSAFRSVRCGVAIIAAGLVALAAGCATGDYSYVKTTAYGERLTFPLVRGQPQWTKQGDISIWAASLLPSGDLEKKEVFYAFGFTDATGEVPKKVRIEDVSDEKPVLIVEDNAPTLDEYKRWKLAPRALKAGDPEIHWTTYVGDTFRVFKFTITKPNGREIVLHQAMSVPGWMKASMRKALGID